MAHESTDTESLATTHGHLTTRRGFVTGMGFGVISLYGLWAAYGAAPTSFEFVTSAEAGDAMGHGATGGMLPEEFRRLTEEFIAANELPDGSVRPRLHGAEENAADHVDAGNGHGHDSAGAHDSEAPRAIAAAEEHDDETPHGHESASAHAMDAADEHVDETPHAHDAAPAPARVDDHGHEGLTAARAVAEHQDEPIDVYLMATRYGYQPHLLRLDRHVPYRFQIMALDADHGASILMAVAGRMIRCPARTLTQQTLTFSAPGEFLVYCTVYCGEGHDFMWSRIIVT